MRVLDGLKEKSNKENRFQSKWEKSLITLHLKVQICKKEPRRATEVPLYSNKYPHKKEMLRRRMHKQK